MVTGSNTSEASADNDDDALGADIMGLMPSQLVRSPSADAANWASGMFEEALGKQYLYIQMELCTGQTLRHRIG